MKEKIKVFDISYKIKNKAIVDGVSFSVYENDVFALLGENGSGKSTLIDLMLNDLRSNSGYVNFCGKEKSNFTNVGIVYDHLPLFPLLKVVEIIRYFSSIHKLGYKAIKDRYFEIFDIDKISNNYIKELSQGERKRIGLLLSVIHNPGLLILDEPFANLDPTIIDKIWRVLKNNRTIFLTTHNWEMIKHIATKVAFIFDGKLISEAKSPEEIIKKLPANKKIMVSSEIAGSHELEHLHCYSDEKELHIFFDEKTNTLDVIQKLTNSFTVQEVSLKDAYAYQLMNYKNG